MALAQPELWLAAVLGLCLLLALLLGPLLGLVKLALRSCLWLGVLACLRQVGGTLGIALGVNPINAVLLGLLGAPGLALLLMLKWLLM